MTLGSSTVGLAGGDCEKIVCSYGTGTYFPRRLAKIVVLLRFSHYD